MRGRIAAPASLREAAAGWALPMHFVRNLIKHGLFREALGVRRVLASL